MAEWNPGPDPFPAATIDKITDFEYLDELKFVRHAQVHVDKTPARFGNYPPNSARA